MPFPTGHSAGFAAKSKGTGTWAILLATSCLAASPALAQSRWSKSALRVTPNDQWGPFMFGKGGSRLATDKALNVYVNLDDSLCIGASNGSSWRVSRLKQSRAWGATAMGLGWDGTLLWDNGISRDQGRTWKPFGGTEGRIVNSSAYAVLGNGAMLAGGSYDHLDLSLDSGVTWAQVHFGKTFGSVAAIVSGAAGDKWAFSSPGYDDLLASRDHGKTWVEATTLVKGKAPQPIKAKYVACNPGQHVLYALTDPNTSDPVIEELHWIQDSLQSVTHQATRTFPDSQVSAFATPQITYFSSPGLWVGTWGQGVWVSSDGGKSWSPRNEGLGDLHVEAIAIGADGTAHVLTKDGLYSLAGTVGIASSPALRAQAARPAARRGAAVLFGFGGDRGNGSEVVNPSQNLFRADGRAARLPSTEQRPAVGAP